MRNLHRWTDAFPTITYLLSVGEEDIADVAAKRFELLLPLAGLDFDDRPGQAARVGFVLDVGVGEIDGVNVTRLANSELTAADPRAQVRPYVALMIEVDAEAEAFSDVPIVVYAVPSASEAGDELPDSIIPNENPFVLKDRTGGVVATRAIEV